MLYHLHKGRMKIKKLLSLGIWFHFHIAFSRLLETWFILRNIKTQNIFKFSN